MSAASAMLVTLTVEQLGELLDQRVLAAVNLALQQHHAQPVSSLDSDEAALYLKIPVDVLRKRVRAGEIPHFKIGTHLRFRVAELDAAFPSVKKKGDI